tara:strand:+ start:2142 stop:2918 length:777 start_codon:yes stop_codon:yes gene_type:complete
MSEENKNRSDSDFKFPSEIIDLPSGGKLYPKDSPLKKGKIEIKYMTAKEEDILTSQNLIKKGIVLDHLMNSVILTEGVKVDDLFVGDKNAVMIGCRILAYGSNYTVGMIDPENGEKFEHTFDLSDLPYKDIPSDVKYTSNEFKFTLPTSKQEVVFKLLNGRDEKAINEELKSYEKLNTSREVTTRLKHQIISINGNSDVAFLNASVDNMLSRDSLALREEIFRISPDINMVQDVEVNGERREMSIPMDVNFFWPSSTL